MRNIKSLCVLRLSALGDVCNIAPSIWELRDKFPNARIVWILGKNEAPILNSLDLKNIEVVIYDKSTGFAGMLKIWRNLRKTKFDVFCIMQNALRANILSLGIRAKIKLGFDWARSKDGHYFFANRHIEKSGDKKIIEAYFDFLKYLGIKNPKWHWRLKLKRLDRKKFNFIDKKYYLLNPCSSSPKRDLSPKIYAELIFEIWQKYKIKCLISGVGSEYVKSFADSILTELGVLENSRCKKATGAYENLVGKTNIDELWSLVEKSEFVISPDSAILHFASAVQVPPIGLYANKNPDYTGSIFGDAYFVNKYEEACEKFLKRSAHTGVYRFVENPRKSPYKKVRFGKSIKSADAMKLIKTQDILNKVSLAILLKDLAKNSK